MSIGFCDQGTVQHIHVFEPFLLPDYIYVVVVLATALCTQPSTYVVAVGIERTTYIVRCSRYRS